MTHELKTWPEPFCAVWSGAKRHEIRKDDRGFKPADFVKLREWDPATSEYTGRELVYSIGFISHGPDWGLPEGLCVFSLVC